MSLPDSARPLLGYDVLRFRVWPAGDYRNHVIVLALNPYQARVAGAIELRVSAEKVRVAADAGRLVSLEVA